MNLLLCVLLFMAVATGVTHTTGQLVGAETPAKIPEVWVETPVEVPEEVQAEEQVETQIEEHTEKNTEARVSLLDHIIAEQATLKTAVGALTYNIRYAEDSDRESESYAVQLTVSVPDKYRFALKKEDQKELFVSDGKVEWHVEIIDEDRFASSTDLKGGPGKFSHITKFLPLRHERLSKNFRMYARTLSAEEKKKNPRAHSLMILEPLSVDKKDHMKWTHIYFDAANKATNIRILDANKNMYDIGIPKMKYNIEVSDDRFTYEDK